MIRNYQVNWKQQGDLVLAIRNVIRTLRDSRPDWAVAPVEAFEVRFEQLQSCDVPATAFTPAMCRFFYEIAYASGPMSIVGLGTYCGIALNLLAAGSVDRHRASRTAGSAIPLQSPREDRARRFDQAVRAAGVDIDPTANALARANADLMALRTTVVYHDADALEYLGSPCNQDRIDLLYIDVDDAARGKADYAVVFERAVDRLTPGAFVLAHDALVPRFRDDLAALHQRVRATNDFDRVLNLPLDRAGLFVAHKKEQS